MRIFICFRLALLHSLSYFSFLHRSTSSSLCTNFDAISSNIDEVLSINAYNHVFVMETLTSIIRTGKLFFKRPYRDIFPISSLTAALIVLLLRTYHLILTLVFVLEQLSLNWEILIMLSPVNSKEDVCFYNKYFDYFVL